MAVKVGELYSTLSLEDKEFNESLDLAKKAAMAAIAAISATMAVSTKEFMAFEKGMNEVFTLLPGISKDAMQSMEGDLKNFSKEFGVLTDQAIPALYQALSAGVPQNNVFDFLEVANKAAIGGVTDLETAVNGMTSVMNAYGQETYSATEVSDKMFTAVRLGKTDFEQLSNSLYNVIPTSSSLGVSFDDVTAALAAMTAQGTPTSVATTQLRQMFVELSKEGSKTADVFEHIAGVSFQEFVEEGNNTQDALKLLEQYANDSNIRISDLFGSVEAGNAALQLTGKGTESFSNALDEMANSAGATEMAYQQMDDTLARSWDRIKAYFEVMMINLGEKLAPSLKNLAEWLESNMPQIEAALAAVFTVIIEGAKLSSALIIGVVDILKWAKENIDWIGPGVAAVFTTVVIGALKKTEWQATKTAIKVILVWLPVIALAAAIGAAIAGLAYLWKKYGDQIVLTAQNMRDRIQYSIEYLVIRVKSSVLSIQKAFWDMIDRILEKLEPFMRFLPDSWQDAFNSMHDSTRTKSQDIERELDSLGQKADDTARRIDLANEGIRSAWTKTSDHTKEESEKMGHAVDASGNLIVDSLGSLSDKLGFTSLSTEETTEYIGQFDDVLNQASLSNYAFADSLNGTTDALAGQTSATASLVSEQNNLAVATEKANEAIRHQATLAGGDVYQWGILGAAERASERDQTVEEMLMDVAETYLERVPGASWNDAMNVAGSSFGLSEADLKRMDIPGLAAGGTVVTSGLTLVGERGPEILNLPKSSQVIPLETRHTEAETSDNTEVHLHIGTLIADDYGLKQLERKLRQYRIQEDQRLGVSWG